VKVNASYELALGGMRRTNDMKLVVFHLTSKARMVGIVPSDLVAILGTLVGKFG
jgi:hypothetical protein